MTDRYEALEYFVEQQPPFTELAKLTGWYEKREQARTLLAELRSAEPVAWVDVPEGDQHTNNYPGYSYGLKYLPAGKNFLYLHPAPDARAQGMEEAARICEAYGKTKGTYAELIACTCAAAIRAAITSAPGRATQGDTCGDELS